MSGPVRPPLKTQLDNGTSENRPVNTIAFANTDFSLTNSGTKTTVSLSGGGGGSIGGSIANTQVAFGSAADTITGTNNFTFDGDRTLKFQGATPRFYLGDTDVSTAENEMLLIMKSGSSSFIYDRQDAGSLNLGAGDTGNHISIKPDGEIIINEGGNAEADVRMESQAYPNMFFLDAGFNKIFMGNGSVSNDADLGIVQISVGNSLQTALSLISTEGDEDAAPTLNFFRNSASPDVQDAIGRIEFKGNDSAIAKTEYASIAVYIQDETAGSQDGDIRFEVLKENSTKEYLRMNSFGVIFNELGADQDFKVESVGNANMFTINGGFNTIGMAGIAQSDSTLTIYDTGTVGDPNLELISTQDDLDAAPILSLFRDDIPSASDQTIGQIKFYGRDIAGTKLNMAQISAFVNDATAGGVESTLKFQTLRTSGSRQLALWDSYQLDFNPSGQDVNFRIRSLGRADMFFVDAGNNNIGIYSTPTTGLADNNPVLQVDGSITGKVPIINTASGTTTITLTTNQIQGQVLYFEDTGAITINLPDCVTGDNIKIFKPSGNLTIATSGSNTINGALSVTRNSTAENALIEVIAVKNNTYIVDNPSR